MIWQAQTGPKTRSSIFVSCACHVWFCIILFKQNTPCFHAAYNELFNRNITYAILYSLNRLCAARRLRLLQGFSVWFCMFTTRGALLSPPCGSTCICICNISGTMCITKVEQQKTMLTFTCFISVKRRIY